MNNKDKVLCIYRNIQENYYDKSENLYYETLNGKQGLDENKYSFNWPLGVLFQGYVDMSKSLDKNTDLIDKCSLSLDRYYNSVLPPAPGYDSYVYNLGGAQRYYDDNMWYGIAFMDAYQRFDKKQYLKKAKETYNFIITGYSESMGGGIYWRENDLETKNTCSNGPAIVLALKLYQSTADKKYIDLSLKLYAWVNKNLQTPENVFWDHINKDGSIDETTWTYNTGIMIQSDALFYEITKDEKYLIHGKELAEGSIKHFFNQGMLPETYAFNAVLLRGYDQLYQIDNNPKYINIFSNYAEKAWEELRNGNGSFGHYNSDTEKPKELIDQGAALEMYSRLIRLKGNK